MSGAVRTVFLSSTSRDLSECREAVYRAIEGLQGYHCARMEDFGSWDSNPDEVCRQLVANCELFIILGGTLYGSVAPAGESYTVREFRTAVAAGKPYLVFVTSDAFNGPGSAEADELRARQMEFREELGRERMVSKFANPQDAALNVVKAIRNWEASGAAGGASRLRLLMDGSDAPGREFSGPFVGIGRGTENAFRIDDPEVSWEHGQIVRTRGQYHYKHLSDTNSTIIRRRGREFLLRPGSHRETILCPQDRLLFGGTTVVVDFDLVGAGRGYMPTTKRPQE
jgi:hypothetical protein